MRRVLPLLGAAALVAVLVVGLLQAGSGDDEPAAARYDLEQSLASLSGAPAKLASLHERSNELLGGEVKAVRALLDGLRGTPVVVNKWASWCGPCRHEFPFFQRVATDRGREIAFLGLNSGDSSAEAAEFLAEFPVPYPSYEDPDERVAKDLGIPANYPITLFIDESGETAFIRQGGYRSSADLLADVERYLG